MGTIVNVIFIVIGSLIGISARKLLKETLQEAVIAAMAFCIMIIGVKGAIMTQELLLIIISLVIGTIIGELLAIDDKITSFSESLANRYFKKEARFAQGFMLASCLYGIGAMAILGSIQSGLGNHDTLYAKALLDGITSIFLASVYGIGVMFSALPIFVYQGILTLAASTLKEVMNPNFIRELEALGSIMIIAIAFNTLKITKVKLANILPSLLVLPIIMLIVLPIIKSFL